MEDYLIKTLGVLLFSGLLMGISAHAAPLSQCPAVGNDTQGCELLITVTASSGGVATAFTVSTASPDQGPYDGSDDTLVGILNSSSATLTTIALNSTTDIFGFDGDGACTYIACPGATDPSGYAPAGVTFSGVNSAATSGNVDFNPGLAPGSSGWFSLEEALSASEILPGNSAPEPSSFLLMGVGLTAIAASLRRRLKTK
jgi:PEP-CTERM motif-containing protein